MPKLFEESTAGTPSHKPNSMDADPAIRKLQEIENAYEKERQKISA